MYVMKCYIATKNTPVRKQHRKMKIGEKLLQKTERRKEGRKKKERKTEGRKEKERTVSKRSKLCKGGLNVIHFHLMVKISNLDEHTCHEV